MQTRTVSELNQLIQLVLDTELDPVYWVVGELTDFRKAPQGHAYFELVEKEGNVIKAKIKANLWQFTFRTVAARFESMTGSSLKSGMKVLAQVSVSFHPVYGLSLNVKDIDPSFSLGERARVRQETLARLTAEGILKRNSDLELPPVVQKIAIISSSTAAGYGDFVDQLSYNTYGYQVYHKLYPSLMQGNEAVKSLIHAIHAAEEEKEKLNLQAIVIIRGGGAQLDLDCFDDYRLASAIAHCSLPILTGIGHERDESIADITAHTPLKTPTAVAEFILAGFREFEENLALVLRRLDHATRHQLREQDVKIQQISHHVKALASSVLGLEMERLSSRTNRIQISLRTNIAVMETSLNSINKDLVRAFGNFTRNQKEKLDGNERQLKQLDPASILSRGYSFTEMEGVPIGLVQLQPGDQMTTFTSDKQISSTVTQIEEK